MREIKFRAWLAWGKKVVVVVGIRGFEIEPTDPRIPIVVDTGKSFGFVSIPLNHLMQYTGLKDKNGKEIYEGDIVKMEKEWIRWDNNNGPRVVVFEDGAFSPFGGDGEYSWEDGPDGHTEIIGNIHENPELLEGK